MMIVDLYSALRKAPLLRINHSLQSQYEKCPFLIESESKIGKTSHGKPT